MKKLGDVLVTREPGAEIVIGNSAVVRAMVETGTRVVTAYPGSPTPEIATAVLSIPADKRPFYFEFSTNEKVATEVAFGASVNGHLSCVFFKSVGLNVAADTFVQLNHMNLIGGMVVVIGDDPGANSSQNEQDNRHYARMTYTTLFEPATPTEAYEMYKEAASLSREHGKPVILRLTTHVCHAKEKIEFAAWNSKPVDDTPRFDKSNGPYIPITRLVFPMKESMLVKREQFRAYAEQSRFNQVVDNGNTSRGVITAGVPFLSLQDVLAGIENPPDILSLGVVYPLARERVLAFLRCHDEVKILEELDDYLELEIKALAYDYGLKTRIFGKTDRSDWMGEYTPDKVVQVIRKVWPDLVPEDDPLVFDLPTPRPAQMCPGCGHRTAFFAVRQALSDDDITVGDIGCHTLGFLPPYEVGEVLLCMGHSTGTGAGLSLFNKSRKVVSFIGDSTLFHAGLPGIVNALFNQHNLTLIVMENGTTAMTGHQDHPGSGRNVNRETDAIAIEEMLRGLGVSNIRRTDAYAVKKLVGMIREAVEEEGFKVIIASHPCMLKQVRDKRRAGAFANKLVDVNQDKCTLAYSCISDFACPTFQIDDNGKVTTHPDLCIGDASCLQTCASRAITPPHARGESKGGSHED
jgi:indolepyruvate ferredoxin oxidoreductase, alpha subunit